MDTPDSPQRDEAIAVCETVLNAMLQGESEAWEGLWAPQSALALTEALYGPEGIRQLLDDGLDYDDYILVGCDSPPGHLILEGIVLGAPGPLPFTVIQLPDPPYSLVNVLRSGLALCSTMEHVGYLENLPHRPAPELLLPARARLVGPELRLAQAFDELPRGWRSSACALSAWRALSLRSGPGPQPHQEALLAAVCYQTGPWRLMPLVTTAQWRELFDVTEEEFVAAWQYLHRLLELEFDYYCYMPKLPESGVIPDPTTDGDLMSLVAGFLDTLDGDDEGDWPDEDDEDSGVFPLFPEGN